MTITYLYTMQARLEKGKGPHTVGIKKNFIQKCYKFMFILGRQTTVFGTILY